jgi:hypothetical protein
MRTMTTVGAVLVLVVGVGRGDPPSAVPPALPPIPPGELLWKKPERIDTPAPPTEKGEKPDAKKLKDETEKLSKEKGEPAKEPADGADERTRLRNKLDELVEKLDQQKKNPKPPVVKPTDPHATPTTPPKPILPEGGKPTDLVRAAGNLFKAGDADGAAALLKLTEGSPLPKEDKAFADYLRAACLRKQGKLTDALNLYRLIAEGKDDPFLAESAVVQISAIKAAQELESQLEQLKSRRKLK